MNRVANTRSNALGLPPRWKLLCSGQFLNPLLGVGQLTIGKNKRGLAVKSSRVAYRQTASTHAFRVG